MKWDWKRIGIIALVIFVVLYATQSNVGKLLQGFVGPGQQVYDSFADEGYSSQSPTNGVGVAGYYYTGTNDTPVNSEFLIRNFNGDYEINNIGFFIMLAYNNPAQNTNIYDIKICRTMLDSIYGNTRISDCSSSPTLVKNSFVLSDYFGNGPYDGLIGTEKNIPLDIPYHMSTGNHYLIFLENISNSRVHAWWDNMATVYTIDGIGYMNDNIEQSIKLAHIRLYGNATISSCGNSIIDTGESCDGTNLNGKTCQTQGFTGGTLSCSPSCQFNTAQCTNPNPAVCGNGIVEGTEQCDGANLNGKTCQNSGFASGNLTCANCQHDFNACISNQQNNTTQNVTTTNPSPIIVTYSSLIASLSFRNVWWIIALLGLIILIFYYKYPRKGDIFSMNKLSRFLWENKEGIVGGALVWFVLMLYWAIPLNSQGSYVILVLLIESGWIVDATFKEWFQW